MELITFLDIQAWNTFKDDPSLMCLKRPNEKQDKDLKKRTQYGYYFPGPSCSKGG